MGGQDAPGIRSQTPQALVEFIRHPWNLEFHLAC